MSDSLPQWNIQLLDAAYEGALALVKQALQNGANVEATDNEGSTPLHLASSEGHLDIVQYLSTSHGANAANTDNWGNTPLHKACMNGQLDVERYLLTYHGANLEAADNNEGKTPLLEACWCGHLAVVQELVARGANLEATDNDGWTPLHCACNWGQHDVAQFLLVSCGGANLEATDDDGMTPLHLACYQENLAVVQELVARGADLFVTAANGETAFDVAYEYGETYVVDYLLHAYVEKVTESEGLQAIHSILQAATFSYVAPHPPLVLSLQVQLPIGKLTLDHFQTLLQLFPANLTRGQDNGGALPLHVACRVGAPVEILRLFVLANAAALQTADSTGGLPLHTACHAGAPSLDAIHYVVEQGPNAVQAPNNDGALPLHLLCGSRPSVQTVQFLLGLFQGALELMTNAGDLPLMVAIKASCSESVLQVLLTAYPEALVYMQEYYSSNVL